MDLEYIHLTPEELKQLRTTMMVSGSDLARLLGICRTRWSAYEAGAKIPGETERKLYESLPVGDILSGSWQNPGERLYRLRRALGYSQEELNVVLGLSAGELSHIENGDYRLTPAMAQRIADKCGTTVEWLLFGQTVSATPERRLKWAQSQAQKTQRRRQQRMLLGHAAEETSA